MTGLDDIAAELAIRNLVARYADAVHRRDAADWGATWAADAVWDMPDMANPGGRALTHGRDAITASWQAIMAGFPHVMHMVHTGEVRIDGHSGSGRWYLSEQVQDRRGQVLQFYGVYNDRYAAVDGRWLFARRTFDILYMGPATLPGSLFPHPNAG